MFQNQFVDSKHRKQSHRAKGRSNNNLGWPQPSVWQIFVFTDTRGYLKNILFPFSQKQISQNSQDVCLSNQNLYFGILIFLGSKILPQLVIIRHVYPYKDPGIFY